MSLDTLNKRLSSMLDVGICPYPDSDISIIDRAYLTSTYYSFDNVTPLWQKSYLGKINHALVEALDTIGDTQQEDFNKATFPLYNVYLNPNETRSTPSQHLNMTSYRFKTNWEIHCFNKSDEDITSNFDNNIVLLKLLRSVKNLLGTNKLNHLCEKIVYKGCQIVPFYNNDIIIPQKLVINLEITYSQQRKNPSKGV